MGPSYSEKIGKSAKKGCVVIKNIVTDSKAKGKEELCTSSRRMVKPIVQKNFDDAPKKELQTKRHPCCSTQKTTKYFI